MGPAVALRFPGLWYKREFIALQVAHIPWSQQATQIRVDMHSDLVYLGQQVIPALIVLGLIPIATQHTIPSVSASKP